MEHWLLLNATPLASNSTNWGPARVRRSHIVHRSPTVTGCTLQCVHPATCLSLTASLNLLSKTIFLLVAPTSYLPCVNLRAEACIKYSVSCSPASSQCARNRRRYIGSTFSTAEGMLETISLYEFRPLAAYLSHRESWVSNCRILSSLTSHILSCFFDLSFPPIFAKDLTREAMVAVDNGQNEPEGLFCGIDNTCRYGMTRPKRVWLEGKCSNPVPCMAHNNKNVGMSAVSKLIHHMRPMHAPKS